MKYYNNHNGFTLVELIIVLSLMVIAMGITAISFSNVNHARLESAVEEFIADVRLMQNNTMYSSKKNYRLLWKHDGDNASYELQYSTKSLPTTFHRIREVKLSSEIEVKIEGNLVESIASSSDQLIIEFSDSDGDAEKPYEIDGNNDGVNYVFLNTVTSEKREVVLRKLTGKVYLDD